MIALPLNRGSAGPAGADGAQGPQGPQGDAGPQGVQGPAGPAGADGAQGPQGPEGPQGIQGIQGPAGADGAQGPEGPEGPQGPQGIQGEQGPAGPQGPAGADGAAGAQGPEGPAGPAGADGAEGPAGPQGEKGDTGDAGPQGPAGADGADGVDGRTWLSGSGAPSDLSGSDGDFYLDLSAGAYYGPKAAGSWSGTGPVSIIGPAGAQGETGPAGPTGAQGPQGETGATGATGAAGAQGDPGPGLPEGGSVGQIIQKASATDYDTEWVTPTSVLPVITSATTVYVATTGSDTTGDGTSGAPFATPHKALEYLNGYLIAPGVSVTVSIAAGVYSFSTAITPHHPQGKQIFLQGEAPTLDLTTVTVVSSSGSAGAYDIVYSLSDVTGISANDWAIFYDVGSGTYVEAGLGCYQITAVDTGTNQITVRSTNRKRAPSNGVQQVSFVVAKTVLSSSSGCIHLDQGTALGGISNLVCVTSSTTDHNIRLYPGAFLCIGNNVGLNGGDTGIYNYSGTIWKLGLDDKKIVVSNAGGNGVSTILGAVTYGKYFKTSGNGSNGFYTTLSGHFQGQYTYSCGNQQSNYSTTMHGVAQADYAKSLGSVTNGYYAGTFGLNQIPSATAGDNATDYNPSLNSAGNEYGYNNT